MTLKEFAKMLDGREYGCEITPKEEILAKELGFVVVFGYSDDNAELRGAIDDEIGCYDGDVLEHEDLPGRIFAHWCPSSLDCSWAYETDIPHEKFCIYEAGELYCVGIVCNINKKQTNADRIRAMSDDDLAEVLGKLVHCGGCPMRDNCKVDNLPCNNVLLEWLKQPAEVNGG